MGFPLLDILGIAGRVIDKFIPDPQAKAQAQLQLLQMQQNGELAALAAETDLAKGQLDIDKAEAANPSLFVAGWRPACGWVCGGAFAWTFIFQPMVVFLMAAAHSPIDPKTLPVLDIGQIMPVLLGMLGLGGMRSFEKARGVSSGH